MWGRRWRTFNSLIKSLISFIHSTYARDAQVNTLLTVRYSDHVAHNAHILDVTKKTFKVHKENKKGERFKDIALSLAG